MKTVAPVRLTVKDWCVIYRSLTLDRDCRIVARKLGANGMAAAARGVAPTWKRPR